MYKLIAGVIYFITHTILRKVKVKGKEHIPEAPYIVTCTHTSMVEIIILAMALYPKEIHYMAKQELFENKYLNKLFTSCNAFPVNRQNPGPSTLKIPVKLLKEGKIVGIFPGGSRKKGAPLKKGAATIAVMSKKNILPAVYSGPERFRDIIFKKDKCVITFGEIINTSEILKAKNRNEAIDFITEEMEMRMNKLVEEQ